MSEEMKINENELEEVTGGAGSWTKYAKGTYVSYGTYVVYTVVGGDALSGIAIRFGVTVDQIVQWNSIRNKNLIRVGQKLTIYPTVLR
ncbi:MAG: LysM peptidoglycan-binding domain-containing protein [Oscillospiraceae bacterium]|nr:LysM peptidoglycan-binding domain-containing protein [Oscillospiraceae bacterium]